MSQSPAMSDEMSRDELVEQVESLAVENEQLREQMGEMQQDMAFVKKALTTLTDADLGDEMGVKKLPDAAHDTRTEIEDIRTAVESHGDQLKAVANTASEPTDKDEKVASIAAFAAQKTDANQSKVLVEASEIRGCVGVSRRYAYDLIDSIGESESHEWASVRHAETVTTGSGPKQKKKALKVDCDRLAESSQDPDAVNKFTTRTTEEER